jgi:hypothetical protein
MTATDFPLERIDGGYRVAETDECYIDVLAMLFNWRIAETPKDYPLTINRHWCYAGRDSATLLRAIGQARLWVALGGDEPAGWNKNGQTGEWRAPRRSGRKWLLAEVDRLTTELDFAVRERDASLLALEAAVTALEALPRTP